MKLLYSLQSANAFSLAELPPGRKAVEAKWFSKWKIDEEEVPLLVTHVDDMIAAGSVGDCDALYEALSTEFPTNNLGPLSWYTGCAFER
ncbi:unnamed protein product, partial [Discosporangium mesarthrocarpum]